jgi:hypothetical protein
MAEGDLRAGRGSSSEEFRLLGEAIDHDRARASSSGGGGALWANVEALDGVGLAEHRANTASKRGRTPARPNWLHVGVNKENQAREQTSHLEAKLGVAWRGSWWIGWPARRARNSGEAERRDQSAREGELARNGAGERVQVRAVLKRELGCVGRRRGRGSQRACALVHGSLRGRRS